MTTKVGRRQIRTPKTRATTTEKEEEMTEEGTGMKRMMGKEEPMKKARVRGRKDTYGKRWEGGKATTLLY